MVKVALTGGIGSGKSTVAALFADRGVPVFEADKAGALLYGQPQFCEAVARLLGNQILLDSGGVDRRKVADIVFQDQSKLAQLNALVHPMVMAQFESFCHQHSTADVVLMECAILYEYGLERYFDAVVMVYLDKDERVRRSALRDHVDPKRIQIRIANQMSDEEKLDRSQYVILNYEGNPRGRQVDEVLARLRKK